MGSAAITGTCMRETKVVIPNWLPFPWKMLRKLRRIGPFAFGSSVSSWGHGVPVQRSLIVLWGCKWSARQ